VKKLASIIVILSFSVLAACGSSGSQSSNLLIGKWKVGSTEGVATSPYCASTIEFTQTAQTMIYAGKPATEPASYSAIQPGVFPTTEYVIGTGGHTSYVFSTRDKMVMDTALLCTYVRQ
jgi:hypothetical protein